MSDLDYAAVRTHFEALLDCDPPTRQAGLAAIEDPAVRAEVASLLRFDSADTPFLREQPLDIMDPGEAHAPAITGTRLADRFEVQTQVAEGGFGWVYRGLDLESGAPVAVKLFKPIHDPVAAAEVEAAFAREGAVLQSLADHAPNIVRYLASGTFVAAGRRHVHIVMEWLDGPTLATHLKGRGPLPLDAAIALMTPIAEALRTAHRRGIAHRDLKPSNIICAGAPTAPQLKLIDFGAAKRAADRARGFDSTGGALGMVTYQYSAPEQLDKTHGSSGPWTDVHALALVLVEILAGRHPWAGFDILRTMEAVGAKERPTPRRLDVEVSKAVEAVFAQALHRDPKRRHGDAGAFWDALNAARTAPVKSSWLERLRRR